ncbi:MAG: hypothetical protein GQE15_02140 [Archangiaceae bacterium]|nr:hypothetical protein [Archangiaceae bacterium]
MRPALLVMLAAACDSAVGSRWSGPPLVTVRGQALVPKQREVPEPVRVALVWARASERWSVDSANSLQAPWPTHFTVTATTLPSSDAQAVVVAYADVNGNQQLDLVEADGALPHDVVLGASADALPDGGASGTVLRYLDGTTPPARGLQQGFNLVAPDGGALPFSTELTLELTMNVSLEAWRSSAPPGTPSTEQRPLRMNGSVGRTSGFDAVALEVRDAYGVLSDATLSVNGRAIPFDEMKGRFSQTTMGVLTNLTTVEATAPGHTSASLMVAVPDGLQLLSPSFGATQPRAQPLQVRWTTPSHAGPFVVHLYDEAFTELYSARSDLELHSIPSSALQAGLLTVTVSRDGMAATDAAGSFVLGYQNVSMNVRVLP